MTNLAAQSLALAVGVSALVTVACRKVRLPALLPLLAVGVGLGPSGAGLIEGGALGEALKGIVTVAIGLLIFEGALHLNRHELSHAPGAVRGLLTAGALITWAGAALAAYFALGLSIPLALVLGAALIVTGPTVVQPMLRLVRLSPRLHAALSAEAILIDPIGVVATIATVEIVLLYSDFGPELRVAGQGAWLFLKPLAGGAGVGVVSGLAGYFLLRRVDQSGKPDPQFVNLFAVGLCMTCVGAGEAIASEAGLVAVTICGLFVAQARVLGATELRSFKELIATMLVGTLFVLLASRFDTAQLASVGRREALFVVLLLLVVRPAGVLASTLGSKLSWRERAFASAFAPRGIVALSVIAIVATEFNTPAGDPAGPSPSAGLHSAEASRLETVMFVTIVASVVAATVLSPILAWVLGVSAGRGNAVVLIGAHSIGVAFARALGAHGIRVRLIDNNALRVADVGGGNIDALVGDATDTRWLDDAGAPPNAGWVLAWTGNDDVDQVAGRWGEERFGAGHAVVWSNKPASGALRRLDVGAGRPIASVVDAAEHGAGGIADVADPAELSQVLAWVDKGVVTVATPEVRPPEAAKERRFIGLRGAGASDCPAQPTP